MRVVFLCCSQAGGVCHIWSYCAADPMSGQIACRDKVLLAYVRDIPAGGDGDADDEEGGEGAAISNRGADKQAAAGAEDDEDRPDEAAEDEEVRDTHCTLHRLGRSLCACIVETRTCFDCTGP